jgi:hypothetical protein
MSNFNYADLLPEVMPHVTGDPSEPMAIAAIRNAAIEFCASSWIWRYYPDPVDVEAGENTYSIEPPTGADVTTVLGCKYDGKDLAAKSTDTLDRDLPRWQTEVGNVTAYVSIDTESLMLAKLPGASLDGGLTMTLALQPKRSATAFPGWIAAQYTEALAAGAIARLMKMPGKPWSAPRDAPGYQFTFDTAIAAARASAVSGLGRAVTRTAPQH